jgi:hypothetical protein
MDQARYHLPSGGYKLRLEARQGTRVVERLLSVAETAKKQQKNLFGCLTEAIAANRTGLLAPPLLQTP